MKAAIHIILFASILLAHPPAGAESARSLVASGNELYGAGEYDKALKAYEKAMTEQPEAGEIYFNKGNALFGKGDYEKAREAYQTAALKTKDLALEASAHYNMGNTLFAEGQKQVEAEPKKALAQYAQSVHHYQEALRIDPHIQEAAQNIEVVRLAMKDLADRIKQAEETAKEQQEKSEEQKKAQEKPDDSGNKSGQCQNPRAGSGSAGEESQEEKQEKAAPMDQASDGKKEADEKAAQQEQAKEQSSQSAAFAESPENILREEKENRLQLHRVPKGGLRPVEKDW